MRHDAKASEEVAISESSSAEAFATKLAMVALEMKGREIAILDMTAVVDYTDVVVLVTANNARQVRAIAEALRRLARDELGVLPEGVEGLGAGRWALVDYGSVIVHVFDDPMRGFYDLDSLWSDAVRLPVPDAVPEPGPEPVLPVS